METPRDTVSAWLPSWYKQPRHMAFLPGIPSSFLISPQTRPHSNSSHLLTCSSLSRWEQCVPGTDWAGMTGAKASPLGLDNVFCELQFFLSFGYLTSFLHTLPPSVMKACATLLDTLQVFIHVHLNMSPVCGQRVKVLISQKCLR